MTRLIPSILALALLSACPAAPTAKPGTTPKPATPKPRASASASATPAPAPLPAVPGPYVQLTGSVKLDGAWLVAQGLGTRDAAGAIQLNPGGRLLSDVGGGILAAERPALISDNGGGLVTDNGAGVVATNGARYTALFPPEREAGFRFALAQAAGTQAAVGGAAIIPIDLRTGEPLGLIARSDATGGFSVDVPQALAGNVLLAVRLPAASRTSPALAIRPNLIAPVAGTAAARALDEDTAIVTAYLQACFAPRLEAVLSPEQGDTVLAKLAGARKVVPALKAVLEALITEIRAVAAESGAGRLPPERRATLARQLAHALIAGVDVDAALIDPALTPAFGVAPEPARAAMVDVMRRLREAAGAKLEKDGPQAFAGQPWLPAGATIARGADVPDQVVRAYLIPDDPRGLLKAGDVLQALGVDGPEQAQRKRLTAATYSLVGALGQALIADEAVKADLLDRVRTAK